MIFFYSFILYTLSYLRTILEGVFEIKYDNRYYRLGGQASTGKFFMSKFRFSLVI